MQVTELSAEGLKRQFKIVVPAGDLSAKVDERLAELAKTAQMPGFRQGKVPVGLLKKRNVPSKSPRPATVKFISLKKMPFWIGKSSRDFTL